MKPLLRVLFAAAFLIHFGALHCYGLAAFTTTLLLYGSIYLATAFFLECLERERHTRLITTNIRNLLLFLLIIEFSLTFIFRITNTYQEDILHVFISDYKKTEFQRLMQDLGVIHFSSSPREGYAPGLHSEHRSQEFSYPVTYNRIGLRGPLPDSVPDSSRFNIIILGDSFAESFGAPEDSTFPVLLETELRLRTGRPVSVLNAGFCGSDPLQAISLYQNKLRHYPANLVLMVSNLPDLYDIEHTLHASRMPLSEYFVASSHIFRLIYWGVLSNEISLKHASRKSKQSRLHNIRSLCDSLHVFESFLASSKTGFSLVYLPMSPEILPIPGNLPTSELLDAYARSRLELVNLVPPFRQRIRTRDVLPYYYWMVDGHLNSQGYLLMARLTADALIGQHLLPQATNPKLPGYP